METKISPCTECRRQRRKCFRFNPRPAKCTRCERLGKDCYQIGDDESASEDERLIRLRQQILQAELAIQNMEQEAEKLKNYKSKNNTQLMSRFFAEMHQQSPDTFGNWKIKIKNGGFVIETGIKSISDLLKINPVASYLSPLNSSYSVLSASDKSTSQGSSLTWGSDIYLDSLSLAFEFGREGKNCLMPYIINTSTYYASQNHNKSKSTLSLPQYTTATRYGVLIKELVNIYFECYNNCSPLLHEASYRQRVAHIDDISNDFITLAVCTLVCSIPCEHVYLSAREGRTMADFLYAKAKSILLDQFDEIDKRLENIMGITILIQYMHMTLKFVECRYLISMATQIMIDLRDEFPEYAVKNNLFSNSPKSICMPTLNDYGPTTNIELALYSRHAAALSFYEWLMDYVTDNVTENRVYCLLTLEYLPDEPEKSKQFIESQNILVTFYNHPFIHRFMKETSRVHSGKTCTVTFESIVRLEDAFRECTQNLPAKYHVCTMNGDMTQRMKAIDEITDTAVLKTYIKLQDIGLAIYSCLIQPSSVSEESQDLQQWIKEHSRQELFLRSRLLLHAVRRMAVTETRCNFVSIASDSLFEALDVLVLISLSEDKHIANDAKEVMRCYLQELEGLQLLEKRQESLGLPPLITMRDGETRFNIDYYNQQSHPWFAMMYDAAHRIVY